MSFFSLLFHAQSSSPSPMLSLQASETIGLTNPSSHVVWSIYSRCRRLSSIHQAARRLYRIKGRAKEVSAAAAQKPSSPQNILKRLVVKTSLFIP